MNSSPHYTLYGEAPGDLRDQLESSHGIVRFVSRSRAMHARTRCDGDLDAHIFALPTS